MNKKVDKEYKDIKDVYILQCICSELKSKLQQKENIIKAVREYLKLREDDNSMCSVCGVMSDRLLEILEKENK